MQVTLYVKNVNADARVDLFIPPTSDFLIFKALDAGIGVTTHGMGSMSVSRQVR